MHMLIQLAVGFMLLADLSAINTHPNGALGPREISQLSPKGVLPESER